MDSPSMIRNCIEMDSFSQMVTCPPSGLVGREFRNAFLVSSSTRGAFASATAQGAGQSWMASAGWDAPGALARPRGGRAGGQGAVRQDVFELGTRADTELGKDLT